MMPEQEYTYDPLDLDRPSIRLVKLLAVSDSDVHCEILQTFLDEDEGVPYKALSYTWGGTEKIAKIRIGNAGIMRVTENLFIALRHLRPVEEDIMLWVDAICIDQCNDSERGHQVQQMGDIYKKAESVIVWLGVEKEDSGFLLDTLKDWQRESDLTTGYKVAPEWIQLRCRTALEKLLRRPWFSRIWILQEIAFAKRAFVYCGLRSVSTRILTLAPSALGVELDIHSRAVLDIMPGTLRRNNWYSAQPTLSGLLQKFVKSQASDDRDRIYALLSMSSSAYERENIKADYGKDIQELIRETISVLLFSGRRTSPDLHYINWDWHEFAWNLANLSSAALLCALREKSTDSRIILQLTRDDINPNWEDRFGEAPLMIAERWGNEDVIRLLLDLPGFGVNAEDGTRWKALIKACKEKDEGVIRLLLGLPNFENDVKDGLKETALHIAAENGYEHVVRALLDVPGININAKCLSNETPLSAAVGSSHEGIVKLLLAIPGIDVNTKNDYEASPLCLAVERGHEEIVKLLLAIPGIDVNTKDKYETSPLCLAVESGNGEIAKLLLAMPGVEVNMKNIFGKAPLLVAVEKGNREITKLLVAMPGIDVNTKSMFGRTPLWVAAEEGNEQLVELLLAIPGIEVRVKNEHTGKTLFQTVVDNGNVGVAGLLLAWLSGNKRRSEDQMKEPIEKKPRLTNN